MLTCRALVREKCRSCWHCGDSGCFAKACLNVGAERSRDAGRVRVVEEANARDTSAA